ncbi:cupredoxin family copper-binding protein [Candidatus Woesearchaeota archaeon]|nr:cupredoxin family copper-binding protein [Candidatus Woesearchaeota archaeon]
MKILMILALVFGLLLVAGCAVQQAAPVDSSAAVEETDAETVKQSETDNFQVVVENYKFMPATLDVKVGDTVEWVNKDGMDHTVTFGDSPFDEQLPVGATVSYTFQEAGEFDYLCSFHPSMQGKVIVR